VVAYSGLACVRAAVGFVLNVTEAMLTLTELTTALRQITMNTSTPIIVDETSRHSSLSTQHVAREDRYAACGI
jgi:hypothetical protein